MPKMYLSEPGLSDYAPVADRIRLFYERFPTGRIVTQLHSRTEEVVIFVASAYRTAGDERPAATGWASEREGDGEVNSVACLENTETSAVGRALANLGFTASTKRPSREEMEKASRARARASLCPTAVPDPAAGSHQHTAAPPAEISDFSSMDADPLQRHANAVHDALDLLARAEALGFPTSRVGVMRHHLLSAPLTPRRVSRLERRVRAWITRRRAALD